MNAKKARALRKLVNVDLKAGSEDRTHSVAQVGTKTIAQIQPDGNHTFDERSVPHARTTEERYLYRELKKILGSGKVNPEIKEQLIADLKAQAKLTAESTAETKGIKDE